MKDITQEVLHELFTYNPYTGIFAWKARLSNKTKIGDEAGYLDNHGYIRIKVLGKNYFAHRLAWLYMTGEMPSKHIDHINQNKIDNKFSNLRLATKSQNNTNKKSHKNSTSKYRGVCWKKSSNKWCASLGSNGKVIHIGYFKKEEDAARAYDLKAQKIHGEFACLNLAIKELE